jgi:hypothetical protein
MTSQPASDELNRLVNDYCNGTSLAEDMRRLDEILSCDGEARRFYNNFMFLHAALYADQASAARADEVQITCDVPEPKFARSSVVGFAKLRKAWLAMAASLIAVAAVSSWVTYRATKASLVPPTAIAATDAQGTPVAKVTATRNCLWQTPTESAGFGSPLYAGQRLSLAAGLIEITFNNGAEVVLEGPAEFDVRSPGQAQLREGRIAAVVPERARGFEVSTAGLNVVDLGTEFGMLTDRDGQTEVHVFRGQVMAHLLDESGQQVKTVELNTLEAARITPASNMVARIRPRDDEFVRSLSVATGPHDGLYAYEGFNYPAGPLAEQNGGFGWGGPWFSVEAASDDANTNCVATGSLEYDGMMPAGNRAVQMAQQNRIRRSLSTSAGGVFDAAGLIENQDGIRLVGHDGSTVYLSFLQRVNKIDDVFYGLELHRGDGNANRVLCIGNGAEGCGYGVTSNFNVYGLKNFPSLGKENTDTNFFVIKIEFGAGNRDHVVVYRNPGYLADEQRCRPDAELAGNFAFDRIGLGNFNGSKIHEVDEIRVGTTFRSVTGRLSRGPDGLSKPLALLQPDGRRALVLRD